MKKSFVIGVRLLVAFAILFGYGLFKTVSRTSAQTSAEYILDIREIETADLGLPTPAGLAFSPAASLLLGMDKQSRGVANPGITMIDMVERPAGSSTVAGSTTNSTVNMAYNGANNSLFLLNGSAQELDQVPLGPDGRPAPEAQVTARYNINAYGVQNYEGITFNPGNGRLYLLDPAGKRMIIVTPDANGSYEGDPAGREGRITRIDLKNLGAKHLRGIAYNPTNAHLYVLDVDGQKLFEIDEAGQLFSTRDISPYILRDPQGMVFAPSGDLTDDPGIMNLYIADSGQATGKTPRPGEIIEFSLASPLPTVSLSPLQTMLSVLQPSTSALAAVTASSVSTILTSLWNPPSPDPTGVVFRQSTGNLIVSDSEVDEMPIYAGANVFETTLTGSLQSTCTVLSFSKEPADIAVNPDNNHIFIEEDGQDKIFEINLGPDGKYCTADDTRTVIDTGAFNSFDPEGIAYGAGNLYISDGVNMQVYILSPGGNGVFDGVPPAGDDQESNFDTSVLGMRDPEGIAYNPVDGHLFMVSRPDRGIMVESTGSGALANTYDVSFLNARSMSGIAFAPGSKDSSATNIYISDRGIDNNADPNENDGKIYEITLGSAPPPPPPGPVRLYLSLASNATISSVGSVADEDILSFDGANYAMVFDGSDVGVGGTDLDAFVKIHPTDGSPDYFLMSFGSAITINGLAVDDWDIVRFNPSSLGSNTAGTFSLYFDGNDVGLDTAAEDVDALEVLPDGRLLISTTGNPGVVSGARDEDLLAFTPTSLGDTTSGTWAMYFDGSDVELSASSEDTDAVAVDSNGAIYLSMLGLFSVSNISGDGTDVFVCTSPTTGSSTACTYSPNLFFDGSASGLSGNNVDAFELP